MADADLNADGPPERLAWIPADAARAFVDGDEHHARTLLARARDAEAPGSLAWARLERLYGLVSIHVLREVEGTFALERSDAALLALGAELPTLDDLEARAGAASP
ncbi:hypothetical protein [Deinococcus radiodurans]|uniref:Uncharacterized protein n=1 Tax=Deinococcus radiodurans (strain ATCC 13939 / DSM 20539 / JCM 16871 / CCUG 27074 / LMG 4051 / NBRC 15346 / NCIMB 9279 / VKM B-1422 / R1) TaxID=243230 RepID=Q9RW19_DEIRA|nr:hypothetical protein [Deinococcus radiodurans]AAF10433.1 hypothetical protein DR_0850 [Deinococcus radiodurans R1 = ATCC 13939 = DSM 20539]ANC71939.1 hypothetical protein A2G07_09260 [Deinococcus radiodurans R1 = ATCC 13939 = DSM 20539]QEM70361.1 hypothetical protein DXG80_00315 [Deinococcus radiodurans]UDL00013.1 hypothetical protein E5E91_04405 [Deinococcus radiodurans R1 = ATCC 13939 = DSM 20539]UID69847.1 hypothetical protein DRO_0846 [Deinococcus radiodurans R1 = ATCC 13939 = DSM 20539